MRNKNLIFVLVLALVLCGSRARCEIKTAGSSSQPSVSRHGAVLAWHFVLRGVSVERGRWLVDRAHEAGFNLVTIQMTDGVRLNKAPWKPRNDAWSTKEFQEWVAYAREKGMEVVPEVKLLTHQEKFLQDRYPGLMFNKVTYDPRKEAVYDLVFPLLDEVIALVHPRAVHIGQDEVARPIGSWIRPGEQVLPSELFLQHLLRINAFLKKRGVETWMWGDMLLSPDEFPAMEPKNLHGVMPGYGKAMRQKLPRDIVICDWHYIDDQPDFPSLSVMQQEGFRVIGVTWKKDATIRNFSRYAAAHGAYGMMASTWHTQNSEWSTAQQLLTVSGEAFRVFR